MHRQSNWIPRLLIVCVQDRGAVAYHYFVQRSIHVIVRGEPLAQEDLITAFVFAPIVNRIISSIPDAEGL